jgi:hypothetical protein
MVIGINADRCMVAMRIDYYGVYGSIAHRGKYILELHIRMTCALAFLQHKYRKHRGYHTRNTYFFHITTLDL